MSKGNDTNNTGATMVLDEYGSNNRYQPFSFDDTSLGPSSHVNHQPGWRKYGKGSHVERKTDFMENMSTD